MNLNNWKILGALKLRRGQRSAAGSIVSGRGRGPMRKQRRKLVRDDVRGTRPLRAGTEKAGAELS